MSFELPRPGVVTAFVSLVALAAVVGIAPRSSVPSVRTLLRHRPVRLARHESVPTYYRGLGPRALSPSLAGRSGRAPRLRLPYALGRPRPARPRQQRAYVDYLQEARVDMLRTHGPTRRDRSTWPRAWWWSGTRCRYVAPLALPASSRSRSSAGSPRSGPRRSRWPTRSSTRPRTGDASSTCRPRPCSRRTSSPRSGRVGSPPTRRPRSSAFLGHEPSRPRCACAARRTASRARPLPPARALLRRRRLRARQQREVLRVLPGGADPL